MQRLLQQVKVRTLSKDEPLQPKEDWSPTEIFGPEITKTCSKGHGNMRYIGIHYYESESDKDLHMWECEKCEEIAEESATLTERGTEMLAARFPHDKPPPSYEAEKKKHARKK